MGLHRDSARYYAPITLAAWSEFAVNLLMLLNLTQGYNFKAVRVADASNLCQLENFTKFWTGEH